MFVHDRRASCASEVASLKTQSFGRLPKRDKLGSTPNNPEMAKRKTLKRAFDDFQAQEKQKQRRQAHEKRLAEQDKPKAKKSKKNGQTRSRQIYQPFRDGESVLFVGEGNFSFALAFAKRFPTSAKLSIATSYDKREEALKKYADLEEILRQAGSVLRKL